MFNKDTETITGADLMSVKFWGYYEGSPTEPSSLVNRGTSASLTENCVFYNTTDLTESVAIYGIMFDDTEGNTLI